MTFGEKLQALRKSRGLSQEQMAEVLEVSRQAVSKWELNASMPDADKIVEISHRFSVSTDYLLKDELEADTAAPVVGAADWAERKENEDARRRAALLGCLGAMTLAMLYSIMTWLLWNSWLLYGIGCMAELAACFTFEILLGGEPKEQRFCQRLRFYGVAVWLLAAPVVFILFPIVHILWNTFGAHRYVVVFGIAVAVVCLCISGACYNGLKK